MKIDILFEPLRVNENAEEALGAEVLPGETIADFIDTMGLDPDELSVEELNRLLKENGYCEV